MRATSKFLISSILSQLGSIPIDFPETGSAAISASTLSSLKGASAEQAKSVLLTLHFLFPHELLPALDLLDRRLVSKFRCSGLEDGQTVVEVFYVQSASAVTETSNRRYNNPRYRNAWNATQVHYEVRLDSWNCTCAAFAQAFLKLVVSSIEHNDANDGGPAKRQPSDGKEAGFGGRATKSEATIPICKHILAAAVGDAAPNLFGDSIECKDISIVELAAWSAGWGEA